ncbi:MAG: PaaI family thioesterase [Salinarimonadaceae bacterium]|nr:MAG: PaaI family thioesterase [Salinarimonadaceae bacterium]
MISDEGFLAHVGPVFAREEAHDLRCAFRAQPRHANLLGVVQGGMLMTAGDRALGVAAWRSAGRPCATIQFAMQFVSAGRIGEWIVVEPEIVRVTSSLVFLRGTLRAGERVVASADGVWRILAER